MNETGGGEPKQHFEVVQPGPAPEKAKERVETDRQATEATPGKQATPAALQPSLPVPAMPTAVIPAIPPADDARQAIVSPKTSKLPAKDGDVIERHWVEKAKEIVAETRSDPHKQKTEIAAAKADYIQKRFKKAVKTDDTVTA